MWDVIVLLILLIIMMVVVVVVVVVVDYTKLKVCKRGSLRQHVMNRYFESIK
jgi:sensor domain CHASE-containing protein